MRKSATLASLAGITIAAALIAASVVPPSSLADQGKSSDRPSCICPNADGAQPKPWPKPKFAEARPGAQAADETGALEAIHFALTETEDGGSYVWHATSGAVSGVIQPTASFRDGAGSFCRHMVMLLAAGERTRRAEGIACRRLNGTWSLDR